MCRVTWQCTADNRYTCAMIRNLEHAGIGVRDLWARGTQFHVWQSLCPCLSTVVTHALIRVYTRTTLNVEIPLWRVSPNMRWVTHHHRCSSLPPIPEMSSLSFILVISLSNFKPDWNNTSSVNVRTSPCLYRTAYSLRQNLKIRQNANIGIQ